MSQACCSEMVSNCHMSCAPTPAQLGPDDGRLQKQSPLETVTSIHLEADGDNISVLGPAAVLVLSQSMYHRMSELLQAFENGQTSSALLVWYMSTSQNTSSFQHRAFWACWSGRISSSMGQLAGSGFLPRLNRCHICLTCLANLSIMSSTGAKMASAELMPYLHTQQHCNNAAHSGHGALCCTWSGW